MPAGGTLTRQGATGLSGALQALLGGSQMVGSSTVGGQSATDTGGLTGLLNSLFPNMNLGNIGSALLNQASLDKYATQMKDAATQAINLGNPLLAPQRQPFQSQVTNMEANVPNFFPGNTYMDQYNALNANPSTFMATDPRVQAAKDLITKQEQAAFSKSGNLPGEAITGSAQLGSALAQFYPAQQASLLGAAQQQLAGQQAQANQWNTNVGNLTTLGGFNQQNPYTASVVSGLQGQAAGATLAGNAGLGTILGGNPTQTNTGSNNVGLGTTVANIGTGIGNFATGLGNMFPNLIG
jgi:hypothetical protein